MNPHPPSPDTKAAYRALVQRLVTDGPPHGREFQPCRAVLQRHVDGDTAFEALCMLLEGALADPALPIDDTQILVALLKELATGTVSPGELA